MKSYLIVGIILLAIVALMFTNKKFLETIKNIFKIEELRKRLGYTALLILVYRLGCYVALCIVEVCRDGDDCFVNLFA